MNQLTSGLFRPNPLKSKKRMSFLFVVFCGECGRLSSVSRMGRSCKKCGAGPEHVTRASNWDFNNEQVLKDLRLGKEEAC